MYQWHNGNVKKSFKPKTEKCFAFQGPPQVSATKLTMKAKDLSMSQKDFLTESTQYCPELWIGFERNRGWWWCEIAAAAVAGLALKPPLAQHKSSYTTQGLFHYFKTSLSSSKLGLRIPHGCKIECIRQSPGPWNWFWSSYRGFWVHLFLPKCA